MRLHGTAFMRWQDTNVSEWLKLSERKRWIVAETRTVVICRYGRSTRSALDVTLSSPDHTTSSSETSSAITIATFGAPSTNSCAVHWLPLHWLDSIFLITGRSRFNGIESNRTAISWVTCSLYNVPSQASNALLM